MQFKHWLNIAIAELNKSENPKLDAEVLLSYVTGKDRTFIFSFSETLLTNSEIYQLNMLLIRRKAGEPIAYLIGEREFWSLPFYVSPVTIIPRPDTECLVEQALAQLPADPCNILDLGTGTGAIALAIASERPDCEITAIDLLPDVINLVQRNISRLGLSNVKVKQSYWFDALVDNDYFKLIISNPPYISKEDIHLTRGDIRFEPHTALVAFDNGFADLNHIITHALQYLHTEGCLMVEHGWKQGAKVRKLFINENYQNVSTYHDYSGNERFTLGYAS